MKSLTLRHNARRTALQALYQWHQSGNNLAEIEHRILTNPELTEQTQKMDVPYFQKLFHEIPASLDKIDAILKPTLDRPLSQLDILELFILRMGVYELLEKGVPANTVIDEAIELAKAFAGEDSHKYINAVLDTIKKKLS